VGKDYDPKKSFPGMTFAKQDTIKAGYLAQGLVYPPEGIIIDSKDSTTGA